jgi:tRNA dimethylallyltransferase
MRKSMRVDAVLIAGPTASGKSAAALALAQALGGAIINADSMQVYAELRVLTARPTPDAESRVPHFLYGHVRASERYSAGRYQDEAEHALHQVRERGLLPIFVGGTGLYFGVLTEGLSPIPPVPAAVRAEVRRRFETLGRDAFFDDLSRRDEATAARLRPSDTQRLLRAADVLEATGRPLSAWQDLRGRSVLGASRLARFVLAPPREVLLERIDARLKAMPERDVLDEVRALAGLDPSLPAARALGVPEFGRCLSTGCDYSEALAEVRVATRQYARRQLTWFRKRMRDWKWLESGGFSNLITQTTEYFT